MQKNICMWKSHDEMKLTPPPQCKRWNITKNSEFPLYFSMIFALSTPLEVPPSANAQVVDTDRTLLETVTHCYLRMLQPSGTFPGTLWRTPASSFSEEFCLAWCEAVITLILSTLIASFPAPIIVHPVTISHLPYIKFPNMCGSTCGTSVVLIVLIPVLVQYDSTSLLKLYVNVLVSGWEAPPTLPSAGGSELFLGLCFFI